MNNEHVTVTQAMKPCPFCGGDAELDTRQFFRHYRTGEPLEQSSVYCTRCSANISWHSGDLDGDSDSATELCVTSWNTRIEATANVEPDTQALLQEAREVLTKIERRTSAHPDDTPKDHARDKYHANAYAGAFLTKLDAALGGAE